MCVCALRHSVKSYSLWPHGLQPTGLLCPWGFSGKNTGVGWQALQGIFPMLELNLHLLCLLKCQVDFLPLAPHGKLTYSITRYQWCMCVQANLPTPPLPSFPLGVHTFFSLCLCLYFCLASKIIYMIFLIPHVSVNIQYLVFSFWLTSLCMTVSMSFHTVLISSLLGCYSFDLASFITKPLDGWFSSSSVW